MEKSRKTAGYIVDALCQVCLGLFVTITAAHVLEISQFGQLAFIMALASLQQPIANLGTQQLIYGRVALRPNKTSYLTWQACIITATISILIYLVSAITLFLTFDSYIALIYSAAGLRVLGAVALPLLSDAQARHAIKDFLPFRLATTTFTIIMTSLGFVMSWDAIGFAFIWGGDALIFAIALVTSNIINKKITRSPSKHSIQILFRKASPIAFQTIMIAIYHRFDLLYIQLKFGDEQMAIYSAAVRLAELGNIVASIVTMAIGPIFISMLFSNPKLDLNIKIGSIIILFVAVLASLTALLIGRPMLNIFFGYEYGEGYKILSVYILSTAFVAFGGLCSRALSAKSDTKIQAISGFVGMLAIVIFSILMCDIMGPIGGAWATVFSYALATTILVSRLLYIKKCINQK